MSNYSEPDHPRDRDGKYATKPAIPASPAATDSVLAAASQDDDTLAGVGCSGCGNDLGDINRSDVAQHERWKPGDDGMDLVYIELAHPDCATSYPDPDYWDLAPGCIRPADDETAASWWAELDEDTQGGWAEHFDQVEHAHQWHTTLGASPAEASAWRDITRLEPEEAQRWAAAGYQPVSATEWTTNGFHEPVHARRWQDAGWNGMDATDWYLNRYEPDEARQARDQGINPND